MVNIQNSVDSFIKKLISLREQEFLDKPTEHDQIVKAIAAHIFKTHNPTAEDLLSHLNQFTKEAINDYDKLDPDVKERIKSIFKETFRSYGIAIQD